MDKIKYDDFFQDVKVLGVREQYRRALRFYRLAQRCKKPSSKYINLIAAIYPARAIIEIMLESAKNQELKTFKNNDPNQSRKIFEEILIQKIPYYYLVEKIRIHDFHRFGCLPPYPKYINTFLGGPVKMTANKGMVIMTISPSGPKTIKTGNSSIKEQRTLCTVDGHFYDEESGKYFLLNEILEKYLSAVPEAIAFFENIKRK